ncbi:putative membrane protein [Chlamydiales bacterium STE3]|nr:putative membrane protein [Chlamydiales bacterium STE3]
MNLLIFVSVLLMVLASISYGEMRVFFRQALSQSLWVRYMEVQEGCFYNMAVDVNYKIQPKKSKEAKALLDSLGRPSEDKEEKEKPPKSFSKGAKKINFRILVGRAKDLTPEKEEQFNELIKNLIRDLYSKERFYIELLNKRPNFLEEMLLALKGFATEKITDTRSLGRISFEDKDLDDAWYFMLKQNPDEREGKGPCAQLSFFDFLTDSAKSEVRVYLAPKEILLAAFKGNEQIVSQILEKRQELYKLVDKDYPADKAKEEFQNAFQGYAEFPNILDFTVNKSKPDKS